MEFEEIYYRYFRDVFRYIRSFTPDEITSEEVTQETFVKALKSLHQFDGKKDIRAWLFTIAKHTYFAECENSADTKVEFVENLIDEEQAFLIHQFLHTMEEPYKEVFNLRVFGELSYEKIGMLFGKSSGWARVTFYRAKKKIEEYMEGQKYE